ncbi:MAG: hypothetical protein WCG87_03730 [Bacteroidota bacterium]
MKRSLIILLLSFLPVLAYCKDKNTNYLSGQWKEIKRVNRDWQALSYTDTITIEFKGDKYFWQKVGGYGFHGTYKIEEEKNLDMGRHIYEILENKPAHLVLKEDSVIHDFYPYTPPPKPGMRTTTKPGTPSIVASQVPPPLPAKKAEVYKPVTSIQQMIGHWSVYKRTSSALPTGTVDYSRILKAVVVDSVAKNGRLGSVLATNDPNNKAGWFIESYSNQILNCEGKDKRILKVIKCEDNELIIEEGTLTYYFKQFNRK